MDRAWYISLFLLPEWVSVPGARPFLGEGGAKPQTGRGDGAWGMGDGGWGVERMKAEAGPGLT